MYKDKSGVWFQKSVRVSKVGRFLENKKKDGTMNIFFMRLLKSAKVFCENIILNANKY